MIGEERGSHATQHWEIETTYVAGTLYTNLKLDAKPPVLKRGGIHSKPHAHTAGEEIDLEEENLKPLLSTALKADFSTAHKTWPCRDAKGPPGDIGYQPQRLI